MVERKGSRKQNTQHEENLFLRRTSLSSVCRRNYDQQLLETFIEISDSKTDMFQDILFE